MDSFKKKQNMDPDSSLLGGCGTWQQQSFRDVCTSWFRDVEWHLNTDVTVFEVGPEIGLYASTSGCHLLEPAGQSLKKVCQLFGSLSDGSLNRWEEGLGCGCSSVAWIIEWHCTSSHSFCRIYFFGWPAAPLLGRLPILSKNLTSAKRSRESLREGMLRFFDLGDSMIEPTNDWCNDQFGSSCIMLYDWGGLSHETPERLSTTQNAAHA